tara:strand:- start:876 stop:1799 length:924 start_codon:yes stop_codon:yes gene_type:complete
MIEISDNLTLLEAAVAISRKLLPRPTRLTPGWCAAVASILEATACKPGNVSPDKSFSDLSYDDLCNAALAMVPALNHEKKTSLGGMIKDAVICSRSKTRSNANLGIILAISPLAAASTSPGHPLKPADADAEIKKCNAQDSLDIYDAIKLSTARSLSTRDSYDIHSPAPESIHHAMRHAATTEPTDSIAALWASGYQSLWDSLVSDLQYNEAHGESWEQSIIFTALSQLARTPDSLIIRRHGRQKAVQISSEASAVLELPHDSRATAIEALDRRLRHPCRINPGTTADLVAAALYVHLWNSNFYTLL